MPEISTMFRDLGTAPTIIGFIIIAVIIFSLLKGGKGKGNGGSSSTGNGSSSSSTPTPPPANPQA